MLNKNAMVEDHQLKHEKLVFELSVTGSATPSAKVLASDLPGVCVLAAEGQTAALEAVEAISGMTNYDAPVDADGEVNVLLLGSQLGSIKKVMSIKALEKGSAAFTAATVVPIDVNGGLTAGGNIAFQVDSAINLAAANAVLVVEVDYMLSK